MLCAQAWKPGSEHAREKRGVAGLLLGRTERAAFSIMGYYKMLTIVPCAIQQDLVYLFYVLLLLLNRFKSCPTLCDPIDGSPPGSAVPGILQSRTLEWVTISFSSAEK